MASPRRGFLVLFALTLWLFAPVDLWAGNLEKPEGPPLLEVTGLIGVTNAEGRALFDRQMLEKLPASEISTSTPWTEGPQLFRGVRLVTLLEAVQASGSFLELTALNDYSVTMDLRRYLPYRPLLAYRRNGEAMPIYDKGPLWLVFPQDDNPSIARADVHDYWVWQLTRMTVK